MITPTKIVLIGNFPPDRQESMVRFTHLLSEGFTRLGLPVEIWTPSPWFVNLVSNYRYSGLPKYLGYLDKFLRFPREIRRRLRHQPVGTVYHIIDHSNAVYAPHFGAHPLLVTVHDLLQIRSALGEFPQNLLSRSGQKYQTWILKNLARLSYAACVSEKTALDLKRLAHLPSAAVALVPNALNHPYRPLPAADAEAVLAHTLARQQLSWPQPGPRPRFLITIGGAQWYKNRRGLLTIFAQLRQQHAQPHVLLQIGPAFEPELADFIAKNNLSSAILRLPSVENEELRAAYSLADGLLFPSWEEGFGWPIAEAQACGCPVFTSARAPMTEVGGQAACYFDPADPAAAAATISHALTDTSAMRLAGLLHAQRWEPRHMLDEYLKLYTLALNSSHLRSAT